LFFVTLVTPAFTWKMGGFSNQPCWNASLGQPY
jgi:hypothetical protein